MNECVLQRHAVCTRLAHGVCVCCGVSRDGLGRPTHDEDSTAQQTVQRMPMVMKKTTVDDGKGGCE